MANDKRKLSIQVKPNGPLIIKGAFELEVGGKNSRADRVVVCRCGASGNMPFCDASHNRINFQGD